MRQALIAPLMMLALALPASAFIAQNGMTARQVGPTEIAVDYHPRRSETDYWCAAGDFAQSLMGATGKTRIWRATEAPRSGGAGVVFTLDGAKKAEGAGLSQFGKGPRDGSISVAMATGNFCQPYFPFLWD